MVILIILFLPIFIFIFTKKYMCNMLIKLIYKIITYIEKNFMYLNYFYFTSVYQNYVYYENYIYIK